MNIVIVGAGRVGRALAEKLAQDGHDVSLIDSDPAKVRELSETLDVQVLAGNGATAPELRRAGIERANLVVAVTDRDEVNMVVGLLASFAFKVPRIVVRLRDADHAEGFDLMEGLNYNKFFPGHQIAMAAPLFEGVVEYADGTEATVEQMAHDVTTFLMWTAEPKLEVRKAWGIKVMIFVLVLTVLLYFVKRKVWADVH